jgi:hypothetical protein
MMEAASGRIWSEIANTTTMEKLPRGEDDIESLIFATNDSKPGIFSTKK